MESDLTHSDSLWKAYAWVDAHKKQVLYGTIGVLALAAVITLMVWQQGQKETKAAHALSELQATQTTGGMPNPGAGEAYLKINAEFPGTSAGQHALLLGAGALFIEKKYAESLVQFQKFARDYRDSTMLAQAQMGIATSQESLGKTNEAVAAYNEVIQRHGNSPVAPRAKFTLAKLYLSQNKAEQARTLLEEITKEERFSMVGNEANDLLSELMASHPEWATAPASTNTGPSLSPLPTNTPAVKP